MKVPGVARSTLRRLSVLAHYPAVGAAIVASALILGISAAAGPLFESSVSTNVVQLGMADVGGVLASVSLRGPLEADIVSFQQRMLDRALSRVPDAGRVTTTLAVGGVDASTRSGGARSHPVQLIARDGFAGHVSEVAHAAADTPADGVWVAQSIASALDLSPADEIRLDAGDRSVTARVDGIYRDLFVGVEDPFWAPLSARIYPSPTDDAPPPSPVLATRAAFLRLTTELQLFGDVGWDAHVAGDPTAIGYDEATATATRVRRLIADTAGPETPVGAALQAPSARSPVVTVARDARATHDSVAGPLRTFSLAGVVAGLVGLIAGSVYGIRRRRTEIRMLDAIGLSPARLAIRGAVEAVVPIALGCALGWMVARLGVAAGGPTPLLDRSAVADAARNVVIAAVAGAVVVAFATGAAVRAETESAPSRLVGVARLPWEAALLVLAAAALYEILSRGTGPAVSPDGAVHIDAFLLLFPVLFIAGGAGLAVRALVAALRRGARPAARWPVPAYLAARRLSSSPRAAVLLTTAAALSVGILGYAGTVGRSLDAATFDKARLGIGADVVVGAPALVDLPPSRGLHATGVVSLHASPPGSRRDVSVLAIDPATFARTAFWDDAFADRPLDGLLDGLRGSGGSLRALVVGDATFRAVELGGFTVPVTRVSSVRAFPGQGRGSTLVVATSALEAALHRHGISLGSLGTSYAVWVRGAVPDAVRYVEGLGLSAGAVRTTAAFVGAPRFRAISSTFVYMELLGVLAAVVALIGAVLYLQARHHARVVGYAVSARMGLRRGAHRIAIFLELGSVLLAAALVGTVLALVAGAVLAPRIDPLPSLPPTPAFRPPISLFALIALAVPVAGLVAALLVQRRADRTNVAEELRYAG